MTPWGRAITALRLLQIDSNGLGGIVVQARSGPVRDAFLALLPETATRLHPAMAQDILMGGIDVALSLSEGTIVQQRGLLDTDSQCLILTMAERSPALIASSLALCMEQQRGNWVIALDERTDDDPAPPHSLTDRLAFHVNLDAIAIHDIEAAPPTTTAKRRNIETSDAVLEELVTLAVQLGIDCLRAPSLALTTAKAHAALNNRNSVTSEDILIAAELVLAPRATRVPEAMTEPEQQQPDPPSDPAPKAEEPLSIPDDILLAAIQTALPPDLLSEKGSTAAKGGSGSGAGQKRIGNRKGRPLPARDSARKTAQARVDLMATLRAAVPWQKLRKHTQTDRTGPIIHPKDLRYRRFEDLSDRLLIFAVDASGSAAMARLAEAKGAVELLLAEAYARRDHVALISFRGTEAEVLLPPTRSLVQTKRRLADLPGGGGTPLAAGLKLGLETADAAWRKGLSPVIVLLTDGRSNIALDGTPDRARAADDAQTWARQIAQAGIDSIVIDTGKRPERALRDLSVSLRGHYVSLPRMDAKALSETVSTALEI